MNEPIEPDLLSALLLVHEDLQRLGNFSCEHTKTIGELVPAMASLLEAQRKQHELNQQMVAALLDLNKKISQLTRSATDGS